MKTPFLGWLGKLRHRTSQFLKKSHLLFLENVFGTPSLFLFPVVTIKVRGLPAFSFHMITPQPRPRGHQLAPWQSSPRLEWAPGTLLYFQDIVWTQGIGRGLVASLTNGGLGIRVV